MSKILVLTTTVLAAGANGIAEAIKANPEGAAADVVLLEEERKVALAVAEASLQEVEKQPVAKASEPSFTLEEKNYGFNFKAMTHKGKRITILDVLDNEELQHELVKMESGMIRRIP